jgi:hypothetical protein
MFGVLGPLELDRMHLWRILVHQHRLDLLHPLSRRGHQQVSRLRRQAPFVSFPQIRLDGIFPLDSLSRRNLWSQFPCRHNRRTDLLG